jgi:hypothetical protein
MRNLLVLIVLSIPAAAGDLRLENDSFQTLAYIREDGRIEDASFHTLGYIRDDGRVEDDTFHLLGYLRDGRAEGDSFQTLYYLEDDGRLTDDSFSCVARISDDGTVEDDEFDVILYVDGSDDTQTESIAAISLSLKIGKIDALSCPIYLILCSRPVDTASLNPQLPTLDPCPPCAANI